MADLWPIKRTLVAAGLAQDVAHDVATRIVAQLPRPITEHRSLGAVELQALTALVSAVHRAHTCTDVAAALDRLTETIRSHQ